MGNSKDLYFDARTALLNQLVASSDEEFIKAAKEMVRKDLVGSIERLLIFRDHEDPHVGLKATIHHLKLNELEKTQVEHSGAVQFQPFTIGESLDEVNAQDGWA